MPEVLRQGNDPCDHAWRRLEALALPKVREGAGRVMHPTGSATPPAITFCDKGQCTCTPRKGWRHYTVNGEIVPSVSTVVGLIDKSGALTGWAAKVTAEGVRSLVRDPWRKCPKCYALTYEERCYGTEEAPHSRKTMPYKLPDEGWRIALDLRNAGLDHDSAKNAAADRGTGVHKVLEDWIDHHTLPALKDFPEVQRGYIRGLAKFLRECEPEFRESELMVGSARHGFAGRRDTVANVVGGRGKLTRKGSTLGDLKTSKAIYPETMFPQLEGYDLGGEECGYGRNDHRAIVQVSADGEYEVGYSTATHDDFLAYLSAYNAKRGIEDRWKKATK